MNQHILPLFLLLASPLSGLGAEVPIPEHLKPLAPMLGRWKGRVETKLTHQGKVQSLLHDKVTTCQIADDGNSIVMQDIELNPWTGRQVTTSSVIRHDAQSDKYKAMVWDTEGAVRLFVLDVVGRRIIFKQIDCDEGTTLSSTVTVGEGTFEESGAMVGTGDNVSSVEWKIHYTKD